MSAPTTNQKLLDWVAEVEAMCTPDQVVWCDGSKEEYDRLMELMAAGGNTGPAWQLGKQRIDTLVRAG